MIKNSNENMGSCEDLVSIITPMYNAEKYLLQCIESIVNQSHENIEAIFVDDGSTDNSKKICERYSYIDSRVKILYQKNSGPSSARNLAIQKSSGQFIFFLDADDYIEKNAIKSLIQKHKETEADLIVGDFRKIKNGKEDLRTDIRFLEDKLLSEQEVLDNARKYLQRPNKNLLFAFSWARLFSSSIIKNNGIFFNQKLHTFEDVAFNFDYLNYVKKAYFMNECVYNHRVYDAYSSATLNIDNNPKKLFGYLYALENAENFLEDKIGKKQAKKEAGHSRTYLSIIQLVRTCGQINNSNKNNIYNMIKEFVNYKDVREGLKYYSPSKGDSKIIPYLIRLKMITPLMKICKYKADKRYNKK
jgi:glycosyltransferase involved in cell wall biosynthesis